MKNIAFILSFMFVALLVTPSVVACLDKGVDISYAFTANEEENSSKNQLEFKYTLEDHHLREQSIHFLQKQEIGVHNYKEGIYGVFLDIVSPPPKIISAYF